MTIELKPEDQRIVDLAIQSGAYHTAGDVIGSALSMIAEDLEDGAKAEERKHEPRFPLAEVEEELRALGMLK